MIISPKDAIDQQYVYEILNLELQTQQNGVDLTLKSLKGLVGHNRLTEDSRSHCDRVDVYLTNNAYILEPGVYEVLFNEKFDIPEGVAATIHTRSSLVRGGLMLCAGLYDAGFKGEGGGVLHVTIPTTLGVNMRIAQIVFHQAGSGKLYEGVYNTKTHL